jgi:hypothetical protein
VILGDGEVGVRVLAMLDDVDVFTARGVIFALEVVRAVLKRCWGRFWGKHTIDVVVDSDLGSVCDGLVG